jgi:hypothetical protein
MSTTDNSSDSSFFDPEIYLPRSVRFWIMLLLNIPSTICSLILIPYIIINPTQRRALHTHTILAIMIVEVPIQLLDINFYLVFYRTGSIQPATPIMCLIWWFIDIGLLTGGCMLICWLSIERHILIFHGTWVANRRGRILFHYLPLIGLSTYILLFYIIAIFILPCENTYIYTLQACGSPPCYQTYYILAMWEFVVHNGVSIILEGICSTALLIRVQLQKRRLHQSNQWSKQRRMIIQLSLVSSINICVVFPFYVLIVASIFGLSTPDAAVAQLYFSFFANLNAFLFPVISFYQFPDLHQKIKNKILAILPRQMRRTTPVVPFVKRNQIRPT